jgi:phytanoyl-CoA hydroxylase
MGFLQKISKIVLNKISTPNELELSFAPMWFLDKPNEYIAEKVRDEAVCNALISIRDNGYALLPGNNADGVSEGVLEDFRSYIENNPDSNRYCDQHGHHDRLCNFHMVSKNARDICFNRKTMGVIGAAFSGSVTVIGSLFFEKGSEQSIHRDTPAFFTNPFNHYFGVWNALEDIRLDAGPLIYYEGGHKVAQDKDLYLDESVNEKNYFAKVEGACRDAGLTIKEMLINKGDTIIWHPQLPHGGGRINKRGLTRTSLVFHAAPTAADIYGPSEFFKTHGRLPIKAKFNQLKEGGYWMIDHGAPKFLSNRYEGNFDEV